MIYFSIWAIIVSTFHFYVLILLDTILNDDSLEFRSAGLLKNTQKFSFSR